VCNCQNRLPATEAVRTLASPSDRHWDSDRHTVNGVGLGLGQKYGVIISDVLPGGPAEAAGLMVGDVLVSIDGQPADNLPSVNYYFL
jgi:S1-C subfamily serine protease